jgi:DNA-binding NtrC family response regulator
MTASTTILIADRNSHVRMFLMREMMSYGYCVKLAGTSESVLKIAADPDDIDLLVLDPDLPGLDMNAFLAAMRDIHPGLPILFHTHRHKDDADIWRQGTEITVIEKSGDSVERIKEAVVKLLHPIHGHKIASSDAVSMEGDTT